MKKYLILFCLISLTASAQTRWATQLLGVSSEYAQGHGQQYRGTQALGKPSKLPQAQSGASAWRPAQENTGNEWIKVGFDAPAPVRQVAVAENFGAGCIVQILAYDPQGKEYLLHQNTEPQPKPAGRMWRVVLKAPTPYAVAAIKVVLNTQKVAGWNEIDAIGVSAASQPIEASINLASNLPATLKRENLGPNVNSKAEEVAPIISPDGKTIYFTRFDHPQNTKASEDYDVWFAQEKNGSWQPAQNMGKPVNNSEENSICYISPDDRTALLMNQYRPDGTLTRGVSMVRKNQNGWTFPQAVALKNYTNDNQFSGFYIGPNGDVMVLSLQNQTSIGDADLYVSFRQADGAWSEPKNMGPSINTADAELTPFLATDNRTVYFTSNGYAGYGESDIFLSRRLDDTWTNWSEPENLGPIINTPDIEAHFTIPASGTFAYFCSDENSSGNFDIFRLKLPETVRPVPTILLQGSVMDQKTKQNVPAEVILEDLDQKLPPQKLDYDPAVGDFKIVLDTQKQYGLTAQRKGYQSAGTVLDLTKEKEYREIRRDIMLAPLEVGQKVALNTLLFEQSKFNLLPASLPELDRLAQLMQENQKMEILLEGHTDNVGDFEANLQLSKDRVEEVKRYLTTKNIDAARVQTKGWGPTRPVAPNTSEAARKLNRRVELSVLRME
jgi:outer membrane protein OmpA-like peptidoglycan-associated protein